MTFDIKQELCDLFGVKINPVMDFYFARVEDVDSGKVVVPNNHQLYKECKAWWDDKVWRCYVHKAVGGICSTKYWKK